MILAIVQARMGSTRLPNKVMKDISGRPSIFHVINRVAKTPSIDKVILATSINCENDALCNYVESLGYSVFRGDEEDVLSRFYYAAKEYNAETVVRITGDCPLIDPEVIEQVISLYKHSSCDYASNVEPPTYPDGLDTEVFSFQSLKEAFNKSTEREHVTTYLRKKSQFHKENLTNRTDVSNERWTLDTESDLYVIRNIFMHLYENNPYFKMNDILKLKKSKPDLFLQNRDEIRNKGANMGKGQKLWQRAKQIIPGGNSLLSKRSEMFLPTNWPSYYSKAKGIDVWDMDGNHYEDYCIMGIGTNILGYARDEVNNAVKKAIDDSSCSTLNCYEEVYLAEKLIEMHPWAEQVRYCRTGGEACAMAVRIGRAASGKDGVAFCGYHGWHDWYLASNIADSRNLNQMLLSGLEPNGVPKALGGTSIPFEYNNIDQLKEIVRDNDIGVIIMEPYRNIEPKKGFFEEIRKISSQNGIVFILDEITSAFRQNLGGLHLKMGFEPDIAILGKAMSNGYPMSAVIGKKSVMESAQSTFISSTYWTERIGPVAALETIRIMEKEDAPRIIHELGKYVNKGWSKIANDNNLDITVEGQPSISHFSFLENNLLYKTFITQEMLKKGYLASNSFYISTVHTEEGIDMYLESLNEIFNRIKSKSKKEIKNDLLGVICHSSFQRIN